MYSVIPTTVPCADCALRRCEAFDPMTADEVAFMQDFKIGEALVDPGQVILSEGQGSSHLFTIYAGMAVRSIGLSSGRRQVVSFAFPGDFIGLQASVMGEMKHTVEARTKMRLCVFDRRRMWSLFRSTPERAFDLTWMAATEEQFLGETIATLGQRGGTERTAWAVLQIYRRQLALSLGDDGWVPFPFRQADLADAVGLSLVHTNRTLSLLRSQGLVEFKGRRMRVLDQRRLALVAEDDPERLSIRPLF
jgi:CRP/FNR family transcriptional regulator, anaerobic regulatory protein